MTTALGRCWTYSGYCCEHRNVVLLEVHGEYFVVVRAISGNLYGYRSKLVRASAPTIDDLHQYHDRDAGNHLHEAL
jgi:hypothetical protein